MTTNVLLSFIVCTRNRSAALRRMLASIPAQEMIDLQAELVLIENASDDDTPTVMNEFSTSASFPVRIVREDIASHAVAKNRGIRESHGSLLLFGDDDCLLTPGYLQAIVTMLGEFDYGGGKVTVIGKGDPTIGATLLSAQTVFAPKQSILPGSLMGASMAFRRAVIDTIGDFDPLLFSIERNIIVDDTDQIARASLAGFRGVFDPAAQLLHDHGRSDPADIMLCLKRYDRGRGSLFAKRLADGHLQYLWLWLTQSLGRFIRRGPVRGWQALKGEIGGFRSYRIAKKALSIA